MALVAAAISLEDGEPVMYRQERVGRDGKTFQILKFRSMGLDAEKNGAMLATVGDVRVTRVGKFIRRTSLDELPQLINVLRGEMSIVGPRPERPVFVQQFEQKYPRYAERHLVLAGHHRLVASLRQARPGLRRRPRQTARRSVLRGELVAVHGRRRVPEDGRRGPLPPGRLTQGAMKVNEGSLGIKSQLAWDRRAAPFPTERFHR